MDKILKDIEENLPKIQELSFDIFEDTDTESAGSARMLYNLLYLYQDKYGDEAFTSGKLKTAQDIKEDAAEKLAACRENISAAGGKKAVFKSQTELSGKIETEAKTIISLAQVPDELLAQVIDSINGK